MYLVHLMKLNEKVERRWERRRGEGIISNGSFTRLDWEVDGGGKGFRKSQTSSKEFRKNQDMYVCMYVYIAF